ncbi:unnamed protein product, partial [Prorocentrum cordatum]
RKSQGPRCAPGHGFSVSCGALPPVQREQEPPVKWFREKVRKSLLGSGSSDSGADELRRPAHRGAPVRLVYMQPSELASAIGQPDLQVIDLGGDALAADSIPGALHVPHGGFELEASALVDRSYGGKTLVFYSGASFSHGPLCATQFIRQLQHKYPDSTCKVRILQGGDFAWLITQMQFHGRELSDE